MPNSSIHINLALDEASIEELNHLPDVFRNAEQAAHQYKALKLSVCSWPPDDYDGEHDDHIDHDGYVDLLFAHMQTAAALAKKCSALTHLIFDIEVVEEHLDLDSAHDPWFTQPLIAFLENLPRKAQLETLQLRLRGMPIGEENDSLAFIPALNAFTGLKSLSIKEGNYLDKDVVTEIGQFIKHHKNLETVRLSFGFGCVDFNVLLLALANQKLKSLAFTDTKIADSFQEETTIETQLIHLGQTLQKHPYLQGFSFEFELEDDAIVSRQFLLEHIDKPLSKNKRIAALNYNPQSLTEVEATEACTQLQALYFESNHTLLQANLDLHDMTSRCEQNKQGHLKIKTSGLAAFKDTSPETLIRGQQYLMSFILYPFYQYIKNGQEQGSLRPVSTRAQVFALKCVEMLWQQFNDLWLTKRTAPAYKKCTRPEIAHGCAKAKLNPAEHPLTQKVRVPRDISIRIAGYLGPEELYRVASVTGGLFFRAHKEKEVVENTHPGVKRALDG